MNDLSYQLLYIFIAAWRRRYLIVTPLIILPLVGLTIGLTTAKQYQSHTSMLIQETAKMNPFLEDFAVSPMLKERLDSLQTLLHSRHILGAVAREQQLIDDNSSAQEYQRTIDRLSNGLSMTMVGKDLIRIDYTAGSADGMKQMLTTVSSHFIEQLLAPERSSMEDSAIFLEKYLKQRQQALHLAEQALAKFKDLHARNLPQLHSANISRIAKLKLDLAKKKAQRSGVKKSLGGLNIQLSKTNPIIGKIEEKIIQLRGDLALLKARYTTKHSKVQATLRELKSLERERQQLLNHKQQALNSDQLWDIASSMSVTKGATSQPLLITQLEKLQDARSKLDFLSEEIISLTTMITKFEQTATNFGANQQQFSKLERDLDVKQQLYEELLHRFEMAQMTRALGVFEQNKRIKIIDLPYTPAGPSNYPLLLYVIAGLVAGMLLGSGLATLIALTDNRIFRRDQLERLSSVPVISRIPPLT
ncbi:MAG: chain-length determining protein [Gammaproteobacteria bacterium]|nr:chain-length determining protein [Gammaproteobacteria bacterium]